MKKMPRVSEVSDEPKVPEVVKTEPDRSNYDDIARMLMHALEFERECARAAKGTEAQRVAA